jgi:hypothetical protein
MKKQSDTFLWHWDHQGFCQGGMPMPNDGMLFLFPQMLQTLAQTKDRRAISEHTLSAENKSRN